MTQPALAREALAAPALRRSLAAMVRRRVPKEDAEDVAQTVLCDALAAPSIPADPEDLRRFVAGIARHKVADFHRRARRAAYDDDAHEPAAPPAPIEARAILSRIVSSVATTGREQQTLEWLVREHAGEQLQTIAADEGLPAPAVRQRVSRLRRILRAQWAHALAVVLAVGSCAVLAEHARHAGDEGSSTDIIADPTADSTVRAMLVAQGHWRIEEMTPAARDDGATTAIEAKLFDIHVTGRHVSIVGPGRTLSRTITEATRRADGTVAIDLTDAAGAVQHATASIDGDRMDLVIHDGPFRGKAALVRR